MLKRLSVVILGATVGLMTATAASAQSATQEAKEKTAAAAQKTVEVMSDAEITTAVKTKLLADPKVGGLKIDVDTANGVVTLTGPVHSAAERTQALKLAKETKGVKSVKNKLVMEPAKPDTTTGTSGKEKEKDTGDKIKEKSGKAAEKTEGAAKKAGEETKDAAVKTKDVVADASITAEVKTKLLADPKVGGLKIDVDTKDNVVTLTGQVNSVEEKNEALKLAKNSAGVKRVVDKLTVKQ